MGQELCTRGELKDVGSTNGFVYIERRTGRPRLHRSACESLHRLEYPGLDPGLKLGGEAAHAKYTYFDTFDEAQRYVSEEDRRKIKDVACKRCKPAQP